MKNITKLFAIALVVLGSAATSFAQNAIATAVTNATIITPISIAKQATKDLNFGNIVADADGGTITVSPLDVRTAAGLVLPNATLGTIGAAKFTVTGLNNAIYSIVIPASISITNGAASMTVGSFVSTPTTATGGTLSASGTQEISVGGTLTVGAAQAAGLYTNAADLSVTVAYN